MAEEDRELARDHRALVLANARSREGLVDLLKRRPEERDPGGGFVGESAEVGHRRSAVCGETDPRPIFQSNEIDPGYRGTAPAAVVECRLLWRVLFIRCEFALPSDEKGLGLDGSATFHSGMSEFCPA